MLTPKQRQTRYTLDELRAMVRWYMQHVTDGWRPPAIALRTQQQDQSGQADWGPKPGALKSPPKR